MAANPPDGRAIEKQDLANPPTVPPAEQRTLLPSPFASLISLATATSALSLRAIGFVSHAAISGAKIGTLTSFEVSRAILEGILYRAGSDLVSTSATALNKATAESVLEQALAALHSTITSTSFLVSAGFQIGSTSVSASIALGRHVLTAIDAVLGDTETSKAIATIVSIVQREFRDPETGVHGEHIGLLDVVTGLVAFALLQRWVVQQTREDLIQRGCQEIVWSIVVATEDSTPLSPETTRPLSLLPPNESRLDVDRSRLPLGRSRSFVSAHGDGNPMDSTVLNDNVSIISNASTRRFASSLEATRPEQEFKQQLMQQLRPGSSVRVTAQSVTTNAVVVEIVGDASSNIEPPAGYQLVAAHGNDSGELSQKLVFRNTKKRIRQGSFHLEDAETAFNNGEASELLGMTESDVPPGESPLQGTRDFLANREALADVVIQTGGVRANEKRPRSPKSSRQQHAPAEDAQASNFRPQRAKSVQDERDKQGRKWLRKTLNGSASYKQLVNFWNSDQMGPRKRNEPVTNPQQPSNQALTADFASISPWQSRRTSLTGTNVRGFNEAQGLTPIEDGLNRRHTHRPRPSSVSSFASITTEASAIVFSGNNPYRDVFEQLNSNGFLSGQYPRAPFVHNVARFARFAMASYGTSFLRFMGSQNTAASEVTTFGLQPSELEEHRAFTTYTRLPSSTVLLSSYVDPQGGSDGSGHTETGMPLVHYVSLDHESKAVVVSFRGTLGFEDVLTDMICDYDDFWWRGKYYRVHKGILASARRLLTIHGSRMIATVKAALEEFQDYGLILSGHSLGGSVASVLGIMLAQPNSGDESAFVTSSVSETLKLIGSVNHSHPADSIALTVPANRPIHVYAYGPAAAVSSSLQVATKGLITTIINNQDWVPHLSLGSLRDLQAVALALKTDTDNAKGELRRRVWEGIQKAMRDRSGLSAFNGVLSSEWLPLRGGVTDYEGDDQWPWAAMKSLRSWATATKLMPPGEVFVVESRPVLQRYAFTADSNKQYLTQAARSSKPATHIKVTHIKDVEARFGEVEFGSGMFADHIPARYEKVLEVLEKGFL